MGSYIETNDTLQITTEQGFPPELDLRRHFEKPYTAEEFKDKVFSFKNKPALRIFIIHPPYALFLFRILTVNGFIGD